VKVAEPEEEESAGDSQPSESDEEEEIMVVGRVTYRKFVHIGF